MDMIVPAARGLIDILTRPGHEIAYGAQGAVAGDVDAESLEMALTSLTAGDIEFVILEEGGAFLQIAGDGAGPYLMQHNPADDAEMREVPGGVDRDAAFAAMRAYRGGDSPWENGLEWTVIGAPGARPPREGKRRGLFGRKRSTDG